MMNDLDIFKRGITEIIGEEELVKKLASKKPLRVKAGFDPTAPDLHLGHTVLLTKMRQLQDLGHTIIFLIGDFTAMVGDPSGRLATRPALSAEAIKKNVQTYQEQVFKILDPQKTEVRFNSEWLHKLGAEGMLKLSGRSTVARMLERDDFAKRYTNNEPLSIQEFLYPLLQGWDSVELKADVEIGGTDQKFNLLMGRQLQREEGFVPQAILMLPLLEGTDGVQKMSKSYGNYVGIRETPRDMFGKLMSISDPLMWRYYELLSFKSTSEIQVLQAKVASGELHPKAVKGDLACELIGRYHSEQLASEARAEFDEMFKKGGLPSDVPEIVLPKNSAGISIVALCVQAHLVASNGEARRLIEQGGVKINQEKVTDINVMVPCSGEVIVQAGKRKFVKVKFNS